MSTSDGSPVTAADFTGLRRVSLQFPQEGSERLYEVWGRANAPVYSEREIRWPIVGLYVIGLACGIVAIGLVPTAVRQLKLLRVRAKRRAGGCASCGYTAAGAERCPECGERVPE